MENTFLLLITSYKHQFVVQKINNGIVSLEIFKEYVNLIHIKIVVIANYKAVHVLLKNQFYVPLIIIINVFKVNKIVTALLIKLDVLQITNVFQKI